MSVWLNYIQWPPNMFFCPKDSCILFVSGSWLWFIFSLVRGFPRGSLWNDTAYQFVHIHSIYVNSKSSFVQIGLYGSSNAAGKTWTNTWSRDCKGNYGSAISFHGAIALQIYQFNTLSCGFLDDSSGNRGYSTTERRELYIWLSHESSHVSDWRDRTKCLRRLRHDLRRLSECYERYWSYAWRWQLDRS